MTQLSQTRATRTPPRSRTQRSQTTSDAMVAVAAAGLAALGWVVARAAGIELTVRSDSGTHEVNLVSVVVTSLVVAIAGAGLLKVLERRTTHGRRLWTVVASAGWAMSLMGPLSATEPSAVLVLAGLHLLVGAVVVTGLRRTHRPDHDSSATRRVA
jgi:hypothetical protein